MMNISHRSPYKIDSFVSKMSECFFKFLDHF